MASSSSNPHNSPLPRCPEGYYHAEETPQTIGSIKPNLRNDRELNFDNESEFDFNDYIYMVTKEPLGHQARVCDETLQQIVMSPNSPWVDELKTMVMVRSDCHIVRPAHLPSLIDIWPKIDLPSVMWKLHHFNEEYKGVSKVVPNFLKGIVNPKPYLEFKGPIYQLQEKKVSVLHGCYTDALDIFHITHEMSELNLAVSVQYIKLEEDLIKKDDPRLRCNVTTFVPGLQSDRPTFQFGSAIIVWNARDVTRPSFVGNFTRLVSIHTPMLIILTEVRASRQRFKLVFSQMRTKYGWVMDESCGLMGGAVMLWDTTQAMPDPTSPTVTQCTKSPIRMVVSLKPSKAPTVWRGEEVAGACSTSGTH